MKKLNYLSLSLSILLLSACTSYNYYTAAINKTNLSAYHTFAWMPESDNKQSNTSVADFKIKDAVTQTLTTKGIRLNQKNPDLIVNYTTKIGRGSRTTYYSTAYPGYGFGWGYGWGWAYRPYYYAYGAPFYYNGATYAENEHYKEGTLVIDLIDSRSHKIVWRGFGVGEVHKNVEKNINDLPKIVEGVLSQLQNFDKDQTDIKKI